MSERYKILVIDDEYRDREKVYLSFLGENYSDKMATFDIIAIQTVFEFHNFLKERRHIDAIFLDARLEGPWKDNYTAYGVLQELDSMFSKRKTPPIFLVSKNWKSADDDLLMDVSVNLSTLKNFEHPSAYYDFLKLSSIVDDAEKYKNSFDKEKDESSLEPLEAQRMFIMDEIKHHQVMEKVDAVIVFAVPDEKEKTYSTFGLSYDDDKNLDSSMLVYQKATIDGKIVAFITQANMGLSEAARATESAILAFEPKVVIMIGVCAGDATSVVRGSIIIPEVIYDYSSGKISEDENGKAIFVTRFESISASPEMGAFFQYVKNEEKQRNIITKIQNAFGKNIPEKGLTKEIVTYPMASGPWVVDAKDAFSMIKKRIPHDKLCAIDMEAYAFAKVASIHKVPWLVVKSVQDYANGEKSKDEANAREYCIFSSAMLIKDQLSRILDNLETR